MSSLPLDGTRVIDLTQYAAGPFCTRMLADYGADVVKIEPPGGDPARRLPPFLGDEPGIERSGTFLALNLGKRSVVLDLKTSEGRERLLDLAASADALVESFRPGTMERLGLGYATLREVNPRLVMTSLSNFGQTGPYRDRPATDLTLYAMGGPMIAIGDVDHEPVKVAGRMAGYQGGIVAALATSVGLVAARQRGEGEHIDVSIFEALTHSIENRLTQMLGYQFSGRQAVRLGRASGVARGVYPCADGFVVLTGLPTQWRGLANMVGHPELLERPEWQGPAAHSDPERIAEFDAYLYPWVLARTKAEIRDACQEFGVMGAPLNTIADLLVDRSFVERGFFETIDHPATGELVYPGRPFRVHLGEEPVPPRRRAPLLDEHRDDVLGATAPRSAHRRSLRRLHAASTGDPSKGAAFSTSPSSGRVPTRPCTLRTGARRSSASSRCSTWRRRREESWRGRRGSWCRPRRPPARNTPMTSRVNGPGTATPSSTVTRAERSR